MTDAVDPREAALLHDLAAALHGASGRVREIEVGIPLSIALGRQRPSVACGGCAEPLAFEGVPARTVARLDVPFRLVLERAAGP